MKAKGKKMNNQFVIGKTQKTEMYFCGNQEQKAQAKVISSCNNLDKARFLKLPALMLAS